MLMNFISLPVGKACFFTRLVNLRESFFKFISRRSYLGRSFEFVAQLHETVVVVVEDLFRK